jgi:hypothetical protein
MQQGVDRYCGQWKYYHRLERLLVIKTLGSGTGGQQCYSEASRRYENAYKLLSMHSSIHVVLTHAVRAVAWCLAMVSLVVWTIILFRER